MNELTDQKNELAHGHSLIIDKEYIESYMDRKLTQEEANEIVQEICDNDMLWALMHESIDNALDKHHQRHLIHNHTSNE